MNDLGKQICRCIVGACDDTCRHYNTEKSCCVGYEEVVQQAEKAFVEYENYKDLEEQGKLLKLPCVVGDTVYVLRIDNAAYMMNNEKVWEIVEERFEIRHFDCIWKTVFLMREEAETALKELQGAGKNE